MTTIHEGNPTHEMKLRWPWIEGFSNNHIIESESDFRNTDYTPSKFRVFAHTYHSLRWLALWNWHSTGLNSCDIYEIGPVISTLQPTTLRKSTGQGVQSALQQPEQEKDVRTYSCWLYSWTRSSHTHIHPESIVILLTQQHTHRFFSNQTSPQ